MQHRNNSLSCWDQFCWCIRDTCCWSSQTALCFGQTAWPGYCKSNCTSRTVKQHTDHTRCSTHVCLQCVGGTAERHSVHVRAALPGERGRREYMYVLIPPNWDDTMYPISLVPRPSLLPSLRRSGDPSPKGCFNGGDMGGVTSGLIAISEIVHGSKLYKRLLRTSTRIVFVYLHTNLDWKAGTALYRTEKWARYGNLPFKALSWAERVYLLISPAFAEIVVI